MKLKNFIATFILFCFMIIPAFANEDEFSIPKKPPVKEQKKIDKMINERLKFTPKQKELVKKNHSEFTVEMDKIISQMQKEHDKIRNIYLSGIPPFQANLRSAPAKANLVILKQKADYLRDENRKNFEKILTADQLKEFEKIKTELQFEKKSQKPPRNF